MLESKDYQDNARLTGFVIALASKFDISIVRWIDAGVNCKYFIPCDSEGLHCRGLAMDVVVMPSSREADFIRACSEMKLKTVDFIDYIHVEVQTC